MHFIREKLRIGRAGSEIKLFDYGAHKGLRSYSSASDSTASIPEDDSYDIPKTPPPHPVLTMQGAFEESMKFPDVDVENARNPKGQDLRYHPTVKLVAQIAFGLHLLHKRLAKSETEVVRILQRHVDDMNKFLNRATRNFDVSSTDIDERYKNLKTALDNPDVFEKMLMTDSLFRQQISDGNEKVEYVIRKTSISMEKGLRDIYEGMRGIDELSRYLISLKKGWKNTGLIRTYGAMTSNVEVWARSLETLRKVGLKLGANLEKLRLVVSQVDKKVNKAIRSAKGKKGSFAIAPLVIDKNSTKYSRAIKIPSRTSSLRGRTPQRPKREDEKRPDTSSDTSLRRLNLEIPIAPALNSRTPRSALRTPTSSIVETQLTFLSAKVDSSKANQWKPLPPTPMTPELTPFLPLNIEKNMDLPIMLPSDEKYTERNPSPVCTIELCHDDAFTMSDFNEMTQTLMLRPIFDSTDSYICTNLDEMKVLVEA